MLSRIKDQPAVGKLIAQYDQLPRRDQQALVVLAIAVFLGILYFAVWRPATVFHDQAESARNNAGELLAWMQANEQTIQRLGNAGGTSTSASAPYSPASRRASSSGHRSGSRVSSTRAGESSGTDWAPNAETKRPARGRRSRSMDRASEPGRVSVRLTLAI